MQLHPQLLQDCHVFGQFSLCHLLLLNDSNYPWFILVPDCEDIQEIYQLDEPDQQQLLCESNYTCMFLQQCYMPDKLNIAALGNIVPQLHVHHIARFKHDACWPAPVWGKTQAIPYSDKEIDKRMTELSDWLNKQQGIEFQWQK